MQYDSSIKLVVIPNHERHPLLSEGGNESNMESAANRRDELFIEILIRRKFILLIALLASTRRMIYIYIYIYNERFRPSLERLAGDRRKVATTYVIQGSDLVPDSLGWREREKPNIITTLSKKRKKPKMYEIMIEANKD